MREELDFWDGEQVDEHRERTQEQKNDEPTRRPTPSTTVPYIGRMSVCVVEGGKGRCERWWGWCEVEEEDGCLLRCCLAALLLLCGGGVS